ncbi:type I polyketide synthase, partial [Streptomyces sp. AC495_CC817]|uniref:type I polyketide synthase n=1 Tax=Streptomyces sp. AC495_CC817 TaxID=2823900 RepID=UPI001C27BB22
QPLDVEELYARLAEAGLLYGPAFRGVRALWRGADGELFAEVALPGTDHPGGADAGIGGFTLHPALLDACLHPVALGDFLTETRGRASLPFEWQGLRVHAVGADSVRVRIAAAGPDAVRLSLSDPAGAPVASVETLVLRRLPQGRLSRPDRGDLLRPEWVARPLPGGAVGGHAVRDPDLARLLGAEPTVDAPRFVLAAAPAGEPAAAVGEALGLVQDWLADESNASSTLVVVTRGAVDDPAQAAVAGLVRSARLEHPGRFALLDLADTEEATLAAIPAALAADEPEIALTAGAARVPRLVRVAASTGEPGDLGRILVTGATGTLGRLVAAHLVHRLGIRDLVLAGRRGSQAPGMTGLAADLTQAGARVRVVACDVADRSALAQLVEGAGFATVVHAAGALDDGLVTDLTPQRLAGVLAAKLDAARHLHELLPEARLVLFSSATGVLGGLGQANYAAANAGLDALARLRHARNLPAVSLAWGLWDAGSAMTDGADRARLARSGFLPLPDADALAALDAALASPDPVLAPIRLDPAALRAQGEAVPAPLRDLVGAPHRRTATPAGSAAGSALALSLAGRPGPERERVLLDLVTAHSAAVLGHASSDRVEGDRPFKDAGFGSLTAVELRNRLAAATGLRLPATLVFNHPTPLALARHLDDLLTGTAPAAPAASAASTGADDPVVVVGMGCRLPGGVRNPDDLWDLLVAERDGIGPFPEDRGWPLSRLYDPDPAAAGTSYTRHGGFLDDVTTFDAAFFGVSPREAVVMDPQQRQLLETVWETCEDAGIDPTELSGTRTGVYLGAMYQDYGRLLEGAAAEGFLAPGVGGGVLSGRVAYTYGLQGPTVTVDTACSSSLTALHLAAQAVRAGECELAFAGGVTVLSTPASFVEFSRQRGLAADGRCKPFAAAADGTALGEGVGVVLVERLSRARARGHRVLAVLRASAVNSDGASNGLTAPNGSAQERVMRDALAAGGLHPGDVAAVEAHGTGTALGDPIEAQAVLAVYGRDRQSPLWLGSLKSNIGHVQAAAGVAGVIKAVLAVRHGLLPRSLHIDEPSPHVDWAAGEVGLLSSARPWPERTGPRRMGVSSFGISGTNAHLIVEEAPPGERPPEPPAPRGAPWLLSARSPEALRAQARRLLDTDTSDPAAVARALSTTRAAHRHRAMVTGADEQHLRQGLTALADGRGYGGLRQATARRQRLTLLFTGQGSQLPGMGRGLYEAFPAFARAFDEVCAHFESETPLREAVFERQDLLDRTDYTQPALFALQIAQFRLLASWGVVPDALIGHSIGEVSAACVCGLLSLPDAAALVAARARALGALPAGGAMVSVRAAEAEVLPVLDGRTGQVGIAAVNGPRAVVLSGAEEAVLEVAGELAARGHRTRRLNVGVAFHSPLVEPALADFREGVKGLTFGRADIPLFSTVAADRPMDTSDYWVDQLRDPVDFAGAVVRACEAGGTAFLELGPDAVLTPAVEACRPDIAVRPVSLLRRGRDDVRSATEALGLLHLHGARVDWHAVHGGRPDSGPRLPTYAFRGRRYWPEPPAPAVGEGERTALEPLWSAVDGADHTTALEMLDLRGDETPAEVLAALARLRSGAAAAVVQRACWKRIPDAEVPPVLARDVLLVVPEGDDADADLADAIAGSLVRHGARVRSGGAQRPDLVVVLPGADPDVGPRDGAGSGVPRWVLTRGGGAVEGEHVVVVPEVVDARARARICAAIAGGHRESRVGPDGLSVREYEPMPPVGRWRPEGDVLVAGPSDGLTEAMVEAVLHSGARCLVAGGVTCPPGAVALADAVEPPRLTAAVVRAGTELVDVRASLVAVVSVGDQVGVTPPGPAGGDPAPIAVAVDPDLDPRAAVVGLWQALAGDRTAVRLLAPGRTTAEPAPLPADEQEAVTVIPDEPEPTDVRSTATGEPGDGDAELRRALVGLPRDRWSQAVLGGVRTLASAVLGYDSADDIGPEAEFLDLGLTSVTALELRDHLGTLTGLDWAADVLYECPTPQALTDAVVDRLEAEMA